MIMISGQELTLKLFLAGSNDLGGDYVSCRDEAGQPVDWWVLYKLPM